MGNLPAADITALPRMDDHKIGPAGETFGELKQRVRDARSAFMSMLVRGEADDDLMEAYDGAVRLLKAAYVRVGLPYITP